ncbi:MAG TPA: hypothetical protein VJZ71_13495 [Phycisphaerae bacterium]|nr:hypothetical protein [Phycisphaerae bacterium]
MLRRIWACAILWGMGIGTLTPIVRADSGPWSSPYLPASEADVKRLLEDRTRFIQENYQLPPAESAKVLQALNGLVSVQERYQREIALTLDRLRLVITLVGTEPALASPDQQSQVAKYRGQYHRLLSKAPMSLQNIVKMTEASLSTEQITPARGRIEARFADAVKISGIPFAIENLDALACGPLHPGKRPEIRMPSPETAPIAQAPAAPMPPIQRPKTDAPVRPTPPTIPTPPRPVGPAPPPNVGPPPPQPTAPVAPAPPTTQWPELVKGSADKFDFSADQRTSAEMVLTQSQTRAEEHRQRNQAAYDEAAKLSDEDAKMKKLQELNKPVDAIYEQMQRRIESIASMEQKNKAAQKEKAPKN